MSDRQFDPEATREVATADVPALAGAYERFERLVVDAGAYLEGGGVSEVMTTAFTEYHLLLRNAVVESRRNFDGLGPKLERIAEDDELAEAEIDAAMHALAEETEAEFTGDGYTPMYDGLAADGLTAAPSEFDAELSGAAIERGEGTAR